MKSIFTLLIMLTLPIGLYLYVNEYYIKCKFPKVQKELIKAYKERRTVNVHFNPSKIKKTVIGYILFQITLATIINKENVFGWLPMIMPFLIITKELIELTKDKIRNNLQKIIFELLQKDLLEKENVEYYRTYSYSMIFKYNSKKYVISHKEFLKDLDLEESTIKINFDYKKASIYDFSILDEIFNTKFKKTIKQRLRERMR